LPRGRSWSRAIFGTSFAKRQHGYRASHSLQFLPFAAPYDLESDLFDRDSEPPDQPRNLLQMRGILIPDDVRKPSEAFVIAQ
jgi:hypothetical protein